MEHLTRAVNIITRCTGLYRDEALAEVGLTSCQVPYMMRICRKPGWTQEELARDLYVHKSSVTRTLAALENGGWITRTPDPEDRRALRVYPTEKAEAALPRVCELMEEWNRLLLEELNPEEQACLLTLLSRVTRKAIAAAEPADAPRPDADMPV